jgi:hypothetical protein
MRTSGNISTTQLSERDGTSPYELEKSHSFEGCATAAKLRIIHTESERRLAEHDGKGNMAYHCALQMNSEIRTEAGQAVGGNTGARSRDGQAPLAELPI